jgi:chromate reductase, NAD(P)H dehydrogenase (quinone)
VKILAISGSLRHGSYNTLLVRALVDEAPEGVEFEVWDDLKSIPAYDQDDDVVPGPESVEALRDAVRNVDAVFFATPEYNSSVPGALKNALDWASRPLATNAFRNKPVAVIGASAGMFGAVWAQAEARKVLSTIGARVVDREAPVPRAEYAFGPEGRLEDPELEAEIGGILLELVSEATPVEVA